MSQDRKPPALSPVDDELARNAALFLEADRLEAHAYSLLEGDSTSAVFRGALYGSESAGRC